MLSSGWLARWRADYSMLLVLGALCACLALLTIKEQTPRGAEAGDAVAALVRQAGPGLVVLPVARDSGEDRAFSARLAERLAGSAAVLPPVHGQPRDLRIVLESLAAQGAAVDLIAATGDTGRWPLLEKLGDDFPALRGCRVVVPPTYTGSDFLKAGNLLNVVNQIAVIAILAVGMTLVILGGGIDLSVGSLVALSGVITAGVLVAWPGWTGQECGLVGMAAAAALGVAACAGSGLVSAACITVFRIKPFLVTLATMSIAVGLAEKITRGQTISGLPAGFTWLGRESLLGVPYAVLLMLSLYAAVHLLMAHTVLGRWIYAVGGNEEAARLSGVPVRRTQWIMYTASGAAAGLGGVLLASQLASANPTYGMSYELKAIAAVVLGGTSLAGGEGRVLGTLIGALIMGVVQNGLNLLGVEPFDQKVAHGCVLLAAVIFDQLRRRK